MQSLSPERLRGVAADISAELGRLQQLAEDVAFVHAEIARDPGHARLFYENLALKLHNFYTGCERIFQTVAAELNGAPPGGFDRHRRLLERMGAAWGDRPAALSSNSIDGLREFLAFRHVVRNLYGFELDEERIERLIARYSIVWRQVEADCRRFVTWLETLADQLSAN
jgi:uncharacterized protein YukE